MKRLFLMLLAVVSLIACDKGGDETPKAIELTGGTEAAQIIYADETERPEGIKFRATAPWTATVNAVTSKAADKDAWLRLSAYEGNAGDVTLKFSLDQNNTGKDRKVEIRITCSDTTIAITVEQKATTQSGDTPIESKLITKIELMDNRTEGVRGSEFSEFFYDNLNRVNKIVLTATEIEGEGSAQKTTTWISTCAVSYASNTVSYDVTITMNGIEYKDGECKGEVTLDNNGKAISGKGSYIEEKSNGAQETNFTYSLEYNSDGYLAKSERSDSDDDDTSRFTWKNGNLAEVWWGSNDGKDMIDRALYGGELNKTNLDLNWFILSDLEGFAFACGDSQNIFSLLGYVGKRAKNLVEQLSGGYNGETDYDIKYTYTVDTDGYPTMIDKSRKRYNYDSQGNQTTFEWDQMMPYKITYNK